MSTTYNPEAESIAQIERLEIDARNARRRIDHARNPEDRHALNKQLAEIKAQIEYLRRCLP
jgi:transcription elongation GreA/GreB family factor